MGARRKEWTMKTILDLFDVVNVNSWIFYREHRKKLGNSKKSIIKFLEFEIDITDLLVKNVNNLSNNCLLENFHRPLLEWF